MRQGKRDRAILTADHEETNKFSSATGESHTQTKRLEKESGYYLANNKGIAIVFTPHMGDLPPHAEVPITLTVYNNICGRFEDQIIADIKGLQQRTFPINIAIKGSPVEIPLSQVGMNYNTAPPTMPIPTTVANTAKVAKTLKVRNTGIRAVELNWQIYD